jgi:hypothetical protein
MKTVSTSAVLLLWTSFGIAVAGDPIQLPELYLFHYRPAQRDPFISATAARTLISGEPRVEGVVSGRILEQYLQTLSRLIQKELFVEGVSIADDQAKAVALINGVEFRTGDSLPVPAQPEQISQLEALSRTYGLPLRRGVQPSDSVVFEVGQIKATGVCIVLPGFKATLCEIPFEGDNIPNQIQLERRHSSSNDR